MADETDAMLIDEFLPEFDATIIEHVVVDAPPATVFAATRSMDFMQIHSPIMDAAMFVRGIPAMIGRVIGKKPDTTPPPAMRLSDMFDRPDDGDTGGLEGWLALGENEHRELVFGAVGKVWQPDIEWKTVPREDFRDFDEPGLAKIAANFSLRHYGRDRTILSYEARTTGTDEDSTVKFLRYWWIVQRFVHPVMRAALVTAKEMAEADPVRS